MACVAKLEHFKWADIFNGVYPPGAYFSAEPYFFRPLKFFVPNFRPLKFLGENFRPLKVVPDPLNLMAKISDPL